MLCGCDLPGSRARDLPGAGLRSEDIAADTPSLESSMRVDLSDVAAEVAALEKDLSDAEEEVASHAREFGGLADSGTRAPVAIDAGHEKAGAQEDGEHPRALGHETGARPAGDAATASASPAEAPVAAALPGDKFQEVVSPLVRSTRGTLAAVKDQLEEALKESAELVASFGYAEDKSFRQVAENLVRFRLALQRAERDNERAAQPRPKAKVAAVPRTAPARARVTPRPAQEVGAHAGDPTRRTNSRRGTGDRPPAADGDGDEARNGAPAEATRGPKSPSFASSALKGLRKKLFNASAEASSGK